MGPIQVECPSVEIEIIHETVRNPDRLPCDDDAAPTFEVVQSPSTNAMYGQCVNSLATRFDGR
jgi:hypothetical protein